MKEVPIMCAGCRKLFKDIESFDAHRTGPVSFRRCLQPWEAGLISIEQSTTGNDIWVRAIQ